MKISKLSVAALAAAVLVSAPLAQAASLSYTSTGTTPYSTLSISGSGFSPLESVLVMLGLNSTTTAANSSGSFSSVPLTIPNVPSGLYYIIGVGQSSGMPAFSGIWVGSFYPAAAPSAWYILPGSTLTWSGSGFSPNESITITQGTTTIGTFSADGSGMFSGAASSQVPYAFRNSTAVYHLTSSQSGVSTDYTITVANMYPFANPSTWYAVPGTPLTFGGGGFGPNESVSLYLGTSTSAIATFSADALGSFSGMGATSLPFASQTGGGPAQYRLVGNSSGVFATAPVSLAGFYPSLSPSSYWSIPGTQLLLGGTGFAADEHVAITVGTTTATTTAHTDSSGAFSGFLIQLPYSSNTTVPISAVGALSGATANFTMTLGSYYPSVSPSTWYAPAGSDITFEGSGFAGNETITISGAGSGTVTTGPDGTFTGLHMTLPNSSAATYTFTGGTSGASASITVTVAALYPWLVLSSYWGIGGSPLTVSGNGFMSGEQVGFSAGGLSLGTSTADASGGVSLSPGVPFLPPGDITIMGLGGSSGASASVHMTVAPVYTDLQFGAYAGDTSTAIQIIGHGYIPGEPIEVRTDKTGTTVVASFSADGTGSFDNSSFTPTGISEGNLVVTVKGIHSFDEKSITYYVIGGGPSEI